MNTEKSDDGKTTGKVGGKRSVSNIVSNKSGITPSHWGKINAKEVLKQGDEFFGAVKVMQSLAKKQSSRKASKVQN